jgi:ABC-type antimicrobial peptide transport system permease subunit
MEAVLGETYARERFSTVLLGGFSASALLLAAIGIYGVLAYSVAKRTREIGIRVAVGADAGCIVRMVLAGASRFVLTGLGIGMVGAFAFSRFVSSLLFETGPHDPLTFALTPAILIAVALAAAYIPARRASRLDPLRALRVE